MDLTRPLVPEDLPWLAHTRYWQRLDHHERLRANQLMGLLVNELCLAVERGLIAVGMGEVRQLRQLWGQPVLRQRWDALLEDELVHATWFAAFNQGFAPELYEQDGWCFIAPPAALLRMAALLAAVPGAWRITAWLVLATEEWSCALAQALEHAPVGALGPRDGAFLQLHQRHAQDERSHILLDAELMAVAARDLPLPLRRGMVRLARSLMRQLMCPRRAAPRMIAHFVEEFPRWQPELRAMQQAVLAVGMDPGYWRAEGVAGDLPITTSTAATWGLEWSAVGRPRYG
jgi:hypothetical protein